MENDEYFFEIEFQIWEDIFNVDRLYNYKNENSRGNKFIYSLNFKSRYLIKTKDNSIKLIKEQKESNSNEGDEILFRIRKSLKRKIYEVINPINEYKINTNEFNINYLNFKIWYPVKSSSHFERNNDNYNLNENDIIKFGKKIYIVCKFHFNNNNISYISTINKHSKSVFNIDIRPNQYKININNNKISKTNKKVNEGNKQKLKISKENKIESESENESEYKSEIINESSYTTNTNNESRIKNTINNESEIENENEYNKCWLCFNSNSDINNPLICLCNCHNYIHYECLKTYLSSKLIITENLKHTITTIRCEKFNCDICLKPYHLRFRIPEFDKTYELIDLTLPEETDYVCLESLDFIKDNHNLKILHIVKLIDEEITIGRQNYNDIIDNNISISREHAMLRYNKDNGNLFLEDKNSKYGTLVLVRGNIPLTKKKIFFQIGNIYISINILD